MLRIREASQPHGEAVVWEVRFEGRAAYQKRHRTRAKFEQERAAYELLGASLADAIPELLRVDPERLEIVTAAAEGHLVADHEWTVAEHLELHRQAGDFRRRLDALTPSRWSDPDPVAVRQALRLRLEAWARRGHGQVDPEIIDALERRWSEVAPLFDGVERRFCHRDFSPRNWVAARHDDGLHLTVIDFGLSRGDVPLVDRLKLWDGPWQRRPACAIAFAPALADDDTERFDWLARLHALATVVWSVEHSDLEYEAHGRRLLERLR